MPVQPPARPPGRRRPTAADAADARRRRGRRGARRPAATSRDRRAGAGRARRRAARPHRRPAGRRQPVGGGGGDRRRRRHASTAPSPSSGKVRLAEGVGGRGRPGRHPAAGRCRPAIPTVAFARRVRRRRRDRRRQAGRARRPPRRRQPRRARSSTGCWHRFPELAAVGEPMRPGIVHRLDAGSSGLLVVARTDDGVGRADRAVRRPHRRAPLRRRRVGPPRGAARDHRRADRARPVATRCGWPSSSTASRPAPSTRCSSGYVAPGRAGPAVVRAGDRPDPPDPRPPGRRRPPARRRPDVRRPAHDARPRAARSSTPPSCRSTTRRRGERLTFTSPLPADLAAFLATLEPAHPSV